MLRILKNVIPSIFNFSFVFILEGWRTEIKTERNGPEIQCSERVMQIPSSGDTDGPLQKGQIFKRSWEYGRERACDRESRPSSPVFRRSPPQCLGQSSPIAEGTSPWGKERMPKAGQCGRRGGDVLRAVSSPGTPDQTDGGTGSCVWTLRCIVSHILIKVLFPQVGYKQIEGQHLTLYFWIFP